MAIALKDFNKLPLLGVAVANFAAFVAVTHLSRWASGGIGTLASEIKKALPAGIGLILIGILNAQLTGQAKVRIVFTRWRHALPGCRAFTRYMLEDPRIDVRALERKYGPLPTVPNEQNAFWYRLYLTVEGDPRIQHVNREFLFTRDYTGIALMMIVLLPPLAFAVDPSRGAAAGYCGVMLLQLVVVLRAARHHGVQLVKTVLALKAAEP
jgi:hypothetical protein